MRDFLDVEGRGRNYLEYAVAPDGTEHSMIWQGRLSMRQWIAAPGVPTRAGIARTPSGAASETIVYEITLPWRGMAALTMPRVARASL